MNKSIEFLDVQELPIQFNTFRHGDKWHRQLSEGQRVNLIGVTFDSENKRMVRCNIGVAIVKQVIFGAFGDLLFDHANNNHENIRKNFTNRTAEAWLEEILEDIYGPKAVEDSAPTTVLYLETI